MKKPGNGGKWNGEVFVEFLPDPVKGEFWELRSDFFAKQKIAKF